MRSVALRMLAVVCLLTNITFPGWCADALYERIICVVPIVGTGTVDDPKRPMFAPVAGQPLPTEATKSKGFADPPVITAYHSVPTDDGLLVIVEFMAHDRAAFREIVESTDPSVRFFNPHKTPVSTLLKELRLLRQSFSLDVLQESGL